MEVQGVNISEPGDCRYDESDKPFALAMFSLQCPLIALGVFGNLLVVIVVSLYRSAPSAINELIRALAAADMCYSVCVAMFVFYYEYHYIGASVDYITVGNLVLAFVPLSYTCQTLSYWLVAAIAVNRYTAVCRPTDSLATNTVRRARINVAVLAAGAVAYSIPSYVEHWAWHGTISMCYGYVVYVNNTLLDSAIYQYSYGLAASILADYLGPFCVTAYCSFFIVRTLVRSSGGLSVGGTSPLIPASVAARASSTTSSSATAIKAASTRTLVQHSRRQIAERRLSLIMLVTSAVFMVSVWADAVDKVLWRLQNNYAPKFYLVQTVFSLTNASSDFLIYATMNRKFRETLVGCATLNRLAAEMRSRSLSLTDIYTVRLSRLAGDRSSCANCHSPTSTHASANCSMAGSLEVVTGVTPATLASQTFSTRLETCSALCRPISESSKNYL